LSSLSASRFSCSQSGAIVLFPAVAVDALGANWRQAIVDTRGDSASGVQQFETHPRQHAEDDAGHENKMSLLRRINLPKS
jgi:hypothetical protein